jgi:YgiT-type zinc finger domain-containing protein
MRLSKAIIAWHKKRHTSGFYIAPSGPQAGKGRPIHIVCAPKVAYTVDRKGYHLFIEKIPAYVCSQCGEKYFEEKEVEAIQNMIKALEEKLVTSQ